MTRSLLVGRFFDTTTEDNLRLTYMRPAHAIRPELRRKGFVISTLLYIVIMVIAAALFVSFGYKLIFKEKPNPGSATQLPPEVQEQKADTVDETANWKTYTNKKVGFSLKYPNNWTAKEYLTDNNNLSNMDSLLDLVPTEFNKTGGNIINLSYFENPQNLSLEEYEKDWNKKPSVNIDFYNSSDKQLQTEFSINAFYRKEGFCEPVPCEIYTLTKDYKIFTFSSFKELDKEDKIPDQKKYFDQILSTFKFTN